MIAQNIQVASEERQIRSLAVEAVGDSWRGEVIPRIRITGQWLERAGFRPGHRVQVKIEQPGTLTLQFQEAAL